MKKLIFFWLSFSCLSAHAQERFSNVQFQGSKKQILEAFEKNVYVSGKLTSGETIKSTCSGGSCSIVIEYNGKSIEQPVGDDISHLTIYEYDFSGDGDSEIVVVNDFMDTSFLFVFSYSKGLIQKTFQYELSYYKTEIDKDYIIYYLPSGPENIWHYYQGGFWELHPMEIEW